MCGEDEGVRGGEKARVLIVFDAPHQHNASHHGRDLALVVIKHNLQASALSASWLRSCAGCDQTQPASIRTVSIMAEILRWS